MRKVAKNGGNREHLLALADATSGTIGSLVALFAFYPMDIMKTKTQCSIAAANGSSSNSKTNVAVEQQRKTGAILWCAKILFRGFHYKAAHTVLSNFTYFYVYSMLATKCIGIPKDKTGIRNISAATELLLATMAAMVNIFITLPLDVLSARSQEKLICSIDASIPLVDVSNKSMSRIHTRESSCLYKNDPIMIQRWFSSFNYYKNSISSLWSGIAPSLILCINPAINFTLFDLMKKKYLFSKQQRQNMQGNTNRLSMTESFIFGVFSKLFATLLTYPLIRAKVMLMVTGNNERSQQDNACFRMGKLLAHIYRHDGGVLGLYKGLTLQVLHTSLKSALQLMVRERIAYFVRSLYLGVERKICTPSQI